MSLLVMPCPSSSQVMEKSAASSLTEMVLALASTAFKTNSSTACACDVMVTEDRKRRTCRGSKRWIDRRSSIVLFGPVAFGMEGESGFFLGRVFFFGSQCPSELFVLAYFEFGI